MKKSKKVGLFYKSLPKDFGVPTNVVGEKMLREYGALFVAGNGAVSPSKVIFENESEVAEFQKSVKSSKEIITGFEIELQTTAMKALKKALKDAEENSLTITPRSADSARRSYGETVELWASRVNPALLHWVEKGRMTETQAEKIRSLSPFEQVSEIFKLEAEGIFFSKDLSKSIIYSVAPPGTSQHLSMLALDVKEHGDAEVRKILAHHKWFQTVISDLPHFTYLGITEKELENAGLKKIIDDGRDFWIPNL
jgi:hypothetical protein